MIYIECQEQEAAFYFALEEYFMTQGVSEPLFLFWQTRPTLMLGCYQNIYQEIAKSVLECHEIDIVRRNTGGGTIYTDEGSWQFSFIAPTSEKKLIL